MKREYSFNEISRITMGAPQNQKKAQPQPYYTSSKPRDSWTDMRVEEIKKKYDTPSHRKNYSHFGNQERSRDYQPDPQSNNTYTSYRNPLKDSTTSPNIGKKDNNIGAINNNFKDQYIPKNTLEQSEYVPRFSYDSKQNSNFMDKFAQIKSTMKSDSKLSLKDSKQNYKPRQQNYKPREYPAPATSKIDPRVQNIDKINLKIKKILDCLNQNQKYPRLQQRADLKNSFMMKGSIISKDNQSEQLQETKILSRQKISFDKQPVVSRPSLNMRSSITSSQIKPEIGSKWKYEDKYDYSKNKQQNTTVNENLVKRSYDKNQRKQKVEDQTDSWFEPSKYAVDKSRSRSCLGNFAHEDIKLTSGKKLDDEISKINIRIKQFEEQKKKLNIQFKPYTELKYNRSSSNLSQHKTQRSTFKPPIPRPASKAAQYQYSGNTTSFIQNRQEKMKTQTNQYMNRSVLNNNINRTETSDYYVQKQRYSFDVSKNIRPNGTSQENAPVLNRVNSALRTSYIDTLKMQQKRQKSGTPQFEEKEQSIKSDNEKQQEQQQAAQAELVQNQYQDNSRSNELKMKTEQGIEERKRKLLETATVSFSRETKRLIQNLFEQVKFDQNLRNAKIWFRDLTNPNKWNELREQAKRERVNFDKIQFEITQEEDNPFYSVRDGGENYSSLVNRWINAERYWKQNILGQFNLKQFSVQKFTNDKVDLEKKGYFVVEDLVRFLNMETGTFYRNRDLILVFRRLTQSDKLSWQQFLAKLDQQQ